MESMPLEVMAADPDETFSPDDWMRRVRAWRPSHAVFPKLPIDWVPVTDINGAICGCRPRRAGDITMGWNVDGVFQPTHSIGGCRE